jgi:hypothetical protein
MKSRRHIKHLWERYRRNYALLAVALSAGHQAIELVGLHGEVIQIMGEGKAAGVLLRFHFKGGKVE